MSLDKLRKNKELYDMLRGKMSDPDFSEEMNNLNIVIKYNSNRTLTKNLMVAVIRRSI